MSIQTLAHLKIDVYVFLLLISESSLCILSVSPLSGTRFAIFFHSIGCPFTLFVMSIEAQSILILMESSWSIFSFTACAFG